MLDILNRYSHGFVAVPVILACKDRGLFALLQHPMTCERLAERLGANCGHLQVALRMLQSLQWLVRQETGEYRLTAEADRHREIPEEILQLLHLPMAAYLRHDQHGGGLRKWIESSRQRWQVSDPRLADFLDGVLVIPILNTLHQHHLLGADGQPLRFSRVSPPVREELYELFVSKRWASQSAGEICLTEIGRFMVHRALVTGITASYTPMLSRLPELLFGDPLTVFRRHASEPETHLDRCLNVQASSVQHARYFAEIEEIVLALFDRMPVAQQPTYVVDMGCGDGTLLHRLYTTVRDRSARGRVLDQYPLCMIGVDYNAVALQAAARTLATIPHLVLQGDIGDPQSLVATLQAHGIDDPETILHIRSFLDHDRPFIAPADVVRLPPRSQLPYTGVYVDAEGGAIPPAVMVQSLRIGNSNGI